MIDLKKLDGPFGIPVYHQRMPEMVRAVSLGWLVLTGSADDTTIGSPGLHHWFEHVPFRGTKKFPRGAADIEGPFNSMNGYVNAWTNSEGTCYHGTVHDTQWRKMLVTITDMVANPLLKTDGVEAERKIIHQEIIGKLGSADGRAGYELPELLYPGHPFGYPTLGSEQSLAKMDAETLRHAHKLGYDRSRVVFVCVGNMSEEELLHELESAAMELPDNGLESRRKPAYFGPLPPWKPGLTERETEFATSVVRMLFPIAPNKGETSAMTEVAQTCALLDEVFEHGGITSPLMRIVREERQLVYRCSTTWNVCAGGGYFGFKATSKKENVEAIIKAFGDALKDPALRSRDRLADMKSGLIAETEMMPLDPDEFREEAINQFINSGGAMQSSQMMIERLNKVTIDDVDARLSTLNLDDARLIVFKGMGKS
jgi:predicted Zn-dependent peptidase